ncbi:MAG: hypothetical protein AAGD07_16630 [Planctomycetota bacterium]
MNPRPAGVSTCLQRSGPGLQSQQARRSDCGQSDNRLGKAFATSVWQGQVGLVPVQVEDGQPDREEVSAAKATQLLHVQEPGTLAMNGPQRNNSLTRLRNATPLVAC